MPVIRTHNGGCDDFRSLRVLAERKADIVFELEMLDLGRAGLTVGLDIPPGTEAQLTVHDQRILQPDFGEPVDAFNAGLLIRGQPERLGPAHSQFR